MDITWYGHSCFRMVERNVGSVVCDPYDYEKIGYEPLKLKADIVTLSNDKSGHNFSAAVKGAKSNPFIIYRPGEYEIGGVFVTGYATQKKGEFKNTVFIIEFNGLYVAHLGNIDHVPTQREVERLGTVNVLLVPVGGGASLSAAQAVETVRIIQPNIAIPMHYSVPRTIPRLDPLEKFLKEMGIHEVEQTYTTFKVPAADKLPEDTKIVILEHPLGNESSEEESAA